MSPDGRSRFEWLGKGRKGNLQTAARMAALVREDAWRDEGLKDFGVSILRRAGLDSHSQPEQILDALLSYTQRLRYIADAGGEFDAIHSTRETLAKGYGDCDDLSIVLATLLAGLGFAPSFVLARYRADNDGFDHIYVEVPTKVGKIALDPTSRNHGAGWEKPSLERLVFPIFGVDGALNGFAGSTSNLVTSGVGIGVSMIPGVGPFLAPLVAPIASLFDKTQQRAYESQRDQLYAQAVQAGHDLEARAERCEITPAQAARAAREIVASFYQACDQINPDIGKSCRNFDADFSSYIATMERNPGCAPGATISPNAAAAIIARQQETGSGSGPLSAAGAGATGPGVGSANASGLGGLSDSLPTLLLLAGGAYLAIKLLRG